MNYMDKYEKWVNNPFFDSETRQELLSIKDNEEEIEDRFFKDLKFGTGGLRGVIGAGTNRINKYIVRKATQGLANYVLKNVDNAKERGVVIAYDSRHKSPEFAKQAALVLAGNGIKAYLYESLRSTPQLSFSVRELGCSAGIVITASHNPPQYNGYKVYGEDGGQIVPKYANKIIEEIQRIEDFSHVKYVEESEADKKGLLNIIGSKMDKKYIDKVKSLVLRRDVIEKMKNDFKIIYTPLHGTGAKPVKRVLNEIGFENVISVSQQETPDSDFSTVEYPNPEEHDAFKLAIELAEKEDADIIIGTDPDCDRVGVVVKNVDGKYQVLTGNQTGALLIDYIMSSMDSVSADSVVVKTIVTSELGRVIAKEYGSDTIDTLTGFKYIGEKIKEFEEEGDKRFIFGYEESYGYLAGTFVRDKDGVISSMLISEMAAYYKSKGMTLLDGLKNLYEKYGYYKEDLKSTRLEGKEGLEKIERIMKVFRSNPPLEASGVKVKTIMDCHNGKTKDIITGNEGNIDLPKSNVIKFTLEDESWFAIRPSGTEPKIKIYFSVNGNNDREAEKKLSVIRKFILNKINEIE